MILTKRTCWRNFVKKTLLYYCTFRTFWACQKKLQSTPCYKRAQWSDTGPIKPQPFSMSNTYDWSCICGWEVTNNCHEENLRKKFSCFLFSESISEAYSDYPKEVDIHLLGFDANHRWPSCWALQICQEWSSPQSRWASWTRIKRLPEKCFVWCELC